MRKPMRPRIIKIVFLKELREMLRDRRSLAIMFGIPLVLYPLLTVIVGSIGVSTKNKLKDTPGRVAVVNPQAAPHLMDLLGEKASGLNVIRSTKPEDDLRSGGLDAVLTVPDNAEQQALADRAPEITTKLDRSRTSSLFVEGKVTKVLTQYDKWIVEQRLRDRGQPVE